MKNLLTTFVLVTVLFSSFTANVNGQTQYGEATTISQNNPENNLTPSQILDVYSDNTM